MRISIPGVPTYFILISCCVILLFSCGGADTSEESTAEREISGDELAQLRTQLDLALAQKPNWYRHWVESVGTFDASQFNLILTDTIDPMEMPERNPILPDDPLSPYQFPHPEGDGVMDIYSYKIEAQENIDTPYLNPDSEVVWYRGDGMKERLLFMGPSGMLEEGMWISNEQFVVFGYFQEEEGFRPMAWLIDVDDHVLRQFKLDTLTMDYLPESYINQKIKQVDFS